MDVDDIDNLPQPKDHATLVYIDNIKDEQPELRKSQRFLDDDEDFLNTSDLTDSIKDKNAKKLAKLISGQVEYIEKKPMKTKKNRSSEDLVKLLSNSEGFVKDEMKEVIIQKRVTIKRRKVDGNSNEKHDLQSVTVDPANFINEISFWDKRNKATVYEYKEKKCIAYLREPITEFTKARNKNNWMESKIKTTKYHNSDMNLNVNKR
ncbi:unnamed protein product [Diamesa serratosioi]